MRGYSGGGQEFALPTPLLVRMLQDVRMRTLSHEALKVRTYWHASRGKVQDS
jgi:hypothetical protein